MENNKKFEGILRENGLTINDEEVDRLVAELAADGIVISREEAQRSVYRLAELLLLLSEPLPLPASGSMSLAAEDQSPALGE